MYSYQLRASSPSSVAASVIRVVLPVAVVVLGWNRIWNTCAPLVDVVIVRAQTPSSSSLTTKYLLIGVSGGLQDGFPERNRLDYILQPSNSNNNNDHSENENENNATPTIIPAIFVGTALIRGYKAFLDVMETGYRQYVVRTSAGVCMYAFVYACVECFETVLKILLVPMFSS
jgi:hypothetical protein